MSYISHNLRFWRTKLGLTQQKLASELGVTRGKLQSYEESVEPRQDFLITLVELYNINLHYFFTRKMTDSNYDSFFLQDKDDEVTIEQDRSATSIVAMLQNLTELEDPDERRKVSNEINLFITKMIEENNAMKDELVSFMKRLMTRE